MLLNESYPIMSLKNLLCNLLTNHLQLNIEVENYEQMVCYLLMLKMPLFIMVYQFETSQDQLMLNYSNV
jgi:hypothetical protein